MRLAQERGSQRPCCFNSRTLGRVRQLLSAGVSRSQTVSIHAPWEGCDVICGTYQTLCNYVSIHAPWEGCDYRFNPFRLLAYQFQFTPPGKGATSRGLMFLNSQSCFNSRTLGRVRQSLSNSPRGSVKFQFTHPGKGATDNMELVQTSEVVSIHAPWEGCDHLQASVHKSLSCFNSRTLGRVRRIILLMSNVRGMFQFTHPGKDATVWCKVAYYRADKQA